MVIYKNPLNEYILNEVAVTFGSQKNGLKIVCYNGNFDAASRGGSHSLKIKVGFEGTGGLAEIPVLSQRIVVMDENQMAGFKRRIKDHKETINAFCYYGYDLLKTGYYCRAEDRDYYDQEILKLGEEFKKLSNSQIKSMAALVSNPKNKEKGKQMLKNDNRR